MTTDKRNKLSADAFAKKFENVPKLPVVRESLWKGPCEDGITVSLLSRFLVCRERFRAMVVDGYTVKPEFNAPIEFGNMWHLCEEVNAQDKKGEDLWAYHLLKYNEKLNSQYTRSSEEIQEWYDKCRVMFPIYLDFWKAPESNITPLLSEQVFDVPYALPDGRVVRLRGKWDRVDLVTKHGVKGLRIRDNKTKSRIEEDVIRRQLTFDLQMMFYTVALDISGPRCTEEVHSQGVRSVFLGRVPITGFQYNVVKRPGQYQGKKEDRTGFCNRLRDLVKESPNEFFARWDVPVSKEDIEDFKKKFLNNTLKQLCDWWEWIQLVIQMRKKGGKTDWFENPIHTMSPFGVWNPLTEGAGTHLDRYVMMGDSSGLVRSTNLYPELVEVKQ